MRHLFLALVALFFCLIFNSCQHQTVSQPVLNDYVSEYTTGVISRRTSVEIKLNDPLTPEQQNPEFLKKAFSITPKASGKLDVLDDRILIFQPDPLLQPGTKYTVKLDIGKFFKVEDKNKYFSFTFETFKPEVSFQLQELDVDGHSQRDTIYEINGSIRMSDWTDSTTVHNLIGFDTPVNIVWEKTNISRTFDFRMRTRTPFERAKNIEIFTKKNSVGYPKKVLGKIRIPGKDDFDVYSITPVSGEEEYVEVAFTRSLDPQQDFRGIVQVEPGQDVTFSVEDNKLRIWFQNKTIEEREIIIHNGIRSLYGNRLLHTDASQPERYRKRISFHNNYPNLEFIGQGGILPNSNNMTVPFYATNLRGVIVRVIKVYENNMGQFLQMNQLSDGDQLACMGELLCRKILFLDERSDYNLHTRNAFAVDLKELIIPEPGALYRVILSYNFEMSDYPCPGMVRKSKRELLEENKTLEQQEKADFGNGNAYYYFSDQNWNGYKWDERNMPCKPSYYVNRQISKNILCSNLGVIAKRGDRGKMLVSINNIMSGEPEADVSVGVYTYQNQAIAKQTTWENGTTEIDLNGKEPFYVIAQKGAQRGYLRLANGESLSMSAFDVSGEEVKNGTKGFIYTERGVWRPGDTIFVSFILNNLYGDLPERHPVTFELFNPSGQLYWRKSLSTRADNFYVFKPATLPNSPTGVWNGKITVGGVSFYKKLRIESIKPNRLSINLDFGEKILQRDQETDADLKAQWLTGATANSLKYDIYTTLVPIETTFKEWKGYVFDDPTRKFQADDILFAKGTTNAEGMASIQTKMVQGGFAPGMLRAQFLTKVYEESGDFSINTTQKLYSPFKSYVGIWSPQKDEDPLLTNKQHTFRFVTVAADGTVVPDCPVTIKIFKVEWYWWWSSDMSRVADYVSSSYNKPVRHLKKKSNNIGKGDFSLKVPDMEWGTYYIQITDEVSGHQSGRLAYFDNYGEEARSRQGSEKATLLTLKTDKENYAPGEEVVVQFPSTAESFALLTVEASGGILQHHEFKCKPGATAFRFKATPEMQPNIYVSVTLLNPYASTKHDLPIRLYGVVPVKIHAADSRLEPVIEAPESVRPNTRCKVIVSEQKGRPMTFTLGIVDEGLLDLTNFKTPSPWDAFFAKEALGMRTWDMYNYVLGAYGGKIEQIFSIGGDDALNKGPKAIVNRFKPVVRFFGPYTLNANEKRTMTVDIPEYIGKVRCMVISGNKHQYGNAQKDIFVRQPVMVLGTLPRKLAPGDQIWVPATVFAMEEKVGRVQVNIEVNEAFSIVGKASQEVVFTKEGNEVVWFCIQAKQQLENGSVRLTAAAKGEKATWSSEIEISSPLEPFSKTENYVLKAGETKNIKLTPFGIPGSNKGYAVVSGMQQMNLEGRIDYIINYPYECLEQIISKAFTALYLPDIAQFSPKELGALEEVVRSVNSKLRNYVIPGGGFSYWPGTTSSTGWSSVYAFMYLNTAAHNGFVITPGLRHECGKYQARLAREWKSIPSPDSKLELITQAFRLYALAAANIPEKGAMNRLRLEEGLPTEARWLLSAAYAFDNKEVARKILETTSPLEERNLSFTSNGVFEDALRLIATLSVGDEKQSHVIAKKLTERLESKQVFNTAATAAALAVLSNYYRIFPPIKSLEFDLKIGDKVEYVTSAKPMWTYEVMTDDKPQQIQITNKSTGVVYVQSVLKGIPTREKQFATSNGLEMRIDYKTMQGEPLNIADLKQGTNFIFDITVSNVSGERILDLIIDHMIPAGWEIINKNFLTGSSYPVGVTYQNYRDDRVSSYVPVLPADKSVSIPVMITASYAGRYFMPASTCKPMYSTEYYASGKGEEIEVKRD